MNKALYRPTGPSPPCSLRSRCVDEIEDSNWMRCEDEDGTAYYFNTLTQESTWEVPEEIAKVRTAKARYNA